MAAGVLLLSACGGEPPEGLGGFELGMTQQEVLDASTGRRGFVCRLRGTRPKLALCAGPVEEGQLGIVVRDDSTVLVTLRLDPAPGDEPRRAVGRFAKPFGNPAWRDRPHPPRASPPEGYHTLWLTEDSTRGVELLCAGPRLEPPCMAELSETSPIRVQAKLDTLLGITR